MGRPFRLTEEEREVLGRYLDALDRDDVEAMASVLRDDLRVAYPRSRCGPRVGTPSSRRARSSPPPGDFLFVATSANLQPAVAIYHRAPGAERFRLTALEVLRVEAGQIVDIVDYDLPDLYPASRSSGISSPSEGPLTRISAPVSSTRWATLDVYEPNRDGSITIWGGEKGSPAYCTNTFSDDGDTVSSEWVYPDGGGYQSVMTRI